VNGIADLIPVAIERLPRHPCGACGKRRVLFVLTVYGVPHGVALCAICARLR
jgi:hypothetical protein